MAELTLSAENLRSKLNEIKHLSLGVGLDELGLIGPISSEAGDISVTLQLPFKADPDLDSVQASVKESLLSLDDAKKVNVSVDHSIPTDGRAREGMAKDISNVIAVASGKGGVGKSTVSVNLAVALAKGGAKVGLLDTDVYGPNVPRMMGVDRLPETPSADGKIVPAEAYGVKLMSIGFLVKPEQAMVWRGPMLHNAVRQFVQDVYWGELDYLIVDMPPGTGDVQLSLAQTTPLSGGVIVTLPQEVSVDDARRGMEMFKQMKIPIFGVVENMSYLDLDDGQRVEVFGSGGGQALADEMNVEMMGKIPMDPTVREGGDSGEPVVISHPDSAASQSLNSIARNLAYKAAVAARESQTQSIPISMVEE